LTSKTVSPRTLAARFAATLVARLAFAAPAAFFACEWGGAWGARLVRSGAVKFCVSWGRLGPRGRAVEKLAVPRTPRQRARRVRDGMPHATAAPSGRQCARRVRGGRPPALAPLARPGGNRCTAPATRAATRAPRHPRCSHDPWCQLHHTHLRRRRLLRLDRSLGGHLAGWWGEWVGGNPRTWRGARAWRREGSGRCVGGGGGGACATVLGRVVAEKGRAASSLR
jgi:hypothetical protein